MASVNFAQSFGLTDWGHLLGTIAEGITNSRQIEQKAKVRKEAYGNFFRQPISAIERAIKTRKDKISELRKLIREQNQVGLLNSLLTNKEPSEIELRSKLNRLLDPTQRYQPENTVETEAYDSIELKPEETLAQSTVSGIWTSPGMEDSREGCEGHAYAIDVECDRVVHAEKAEKKKEKNLPV